jgi:hypothetical protein
MTTIKERGHKATVKVEPTGALHTCTVTFTENKNTGPVIVRSIELPAADAREWGQRIAKSLIRSARR